MEKAMQWIKTTVPSRLDSMPWSAWHWRVVIALGITWILDGLEVTLVGAIATTLQSPYTLHLSETQIGTSASAYLAGAVLGALVFGRLTDQWGRKKLFLITLATYLIATFLTAFSWNFWSFMIFRALTGAGIGGEYAAINSAIDELLPARVRGHADLAINSTYWLGTILGSCSTLLLLNPNFVPEWIGWRLAFGSGALLGLIILFVRRYVPESPRWLLLHGHAQAAEGIVKEIEGEIKQSNPTLNFAQAKACRIQPKGSVTFTSIIKTLLTHHRERTILGMSLMIAQAFAYNAIFFTYALILGKFYGVPAQRIGLYLIPFALGNMAGPLVLGRLFDTIGRKAMISTTYALSGVLLALTGYAFYRGWLTPQTQTLMWCIVFFVASAAASSAYLTVSELFPVEIRGMAIALFYAIGTATGGVLAPALFSALIESGERFNVFIGYLIGAGLMGFAALIAVMYGVAAEGKSLEELCIPVPEEEPRASKVPSFAAINAKNGRC